MAKVPKQRTGGQTGGGGRIGQTSNRSASQSRGGRPHAGGGGTGRKPPGKGCAVTALALAGGIVGLVAAAGYGAFRGIEALF